ncbi:MAG: PEP-CTERM sorting domain-containing protein [Armatimonadota bacterium]|nr:PEP-CTERM sorting domain-containing protein [Armatimonadota bacterium]
MTKSCLNARVVRTALSMICGAAALPAASQQLYFNDVFLPTFETGNIRRVNTTGAGLTQLVDTGGGLRGLALDLPAKKMYWADVNNLVIRRSNLDGSGQEDLINLPGGKEPAFPSAVAVDGSGGKLYWGDQTLGTMNRANLDGSDPEVLFNTAFHRGLAIDEVNGKMYWSTSISQWKGEIWRANLDGTDQEAVVTSLDSEFKPNKIALDIAGGMIYWTDYVVDIVRRSTLSGTGIQTLFVPPFNRNPQGIALDLDAGRVYWGQDLEIEGHTGKIMSAGLNGSNPQDFLGGFGHVTEIVFAPVPEPATFVVLGIGLLAVIHRRRR